jgi:hypothetical protein
MEIFYGGDLINRDAHSAFSFKKELIGEVARDRVSRGFSSHFPEYNTLFTGSFNPPLSPANK